MLLIGRGGIERVRRMRRVRGVSERVGGVIYTSLYISHHLISQAPPPPLRPKNPAPPSRKTKKNIKVSRIKAKLTYLPSTLRQ